MFDRLTLDDDTISFSIYVDIKKFIDRIPILNIVYPDDVMYLKVLDAMMTLDIIMGRSGWEFEYVKRRLLSEDYLCMDSDLKKLFVTCIGAEEYKDLISLTNYFGYHEDLVRAIHHHIPDNYFGRSTKELKLRNIENYISLVTDNEIIVMDINMNIIAKMSKEQIIEMLGEYFWNEYLLVYIFGNPLRIFLANNYEYYILDNFDSGTILASKTGYEFQCISSNFKFFVTYDSDEDRVCLTETINFEIFAKFNGDGPSAISNNEKIFAHSKYDSNVVTLYHLGYNYACLMKRITLDHEISIESIEFSPDDQYLLILQLSRIVVIVDIIDAEIIWEHKYKGFSSFYFSLDSKYIILSEENQLKRIDLKTGDSKVFDEPTPLAISFINDTHIIYKSIGQTFKIFNIINGNSQLLSCNISDGRMLFYHRTYNLKLNKIEDHYPYLFQ